MQLIEQLEIRLRDSQGTLDSKARFLDCALSESVDPLFARHHYRRTETRIYDELVEPGYLRTSKLFLTTGDKTFDDKPDEGMVAAVSGAEVGGSWWWSWIVQKYGSTKST
jgi:hypothetical protein